MYLGFKNLEDLTESDDTRTAVDNSKSVTKHYRQQLTFDQNQATLEICNDILSDDMRLVKNSLLELDGQMRILSIPEQEISAFLQIIHIDRIISLLTEPEFQEICFRVLVRLRNSEFSQFLLDCGFLQLAGYFIQQPNPIYAEYSIQIISNNSYRYRQFRDAAYETGLFTAIFECKIVNDYIIAWALLCGLNLETNNFNIEKELSRMLVNLCDRQPLNLKVLHESIKVFSHLTDQKRTEFQSNLRKDHFIYHLSDILQTGKEKYKIKALNILSGCSIKGPEYLFLIFDSNAIDSFDEIFYENKSDEYFEYFLEFVINSLNSDSDYIETIINRYCNPTLMNIFVEHSCPIKCKGCRAIQTMYFLADPNLIVQSLTPDIVEGLICMLFTQFPIDSVDISFFIFQTFHTVFEKLESIQSELVFNVAQMIFETIESEDYDHLINFADNEKISQEAINMKQYVEKLLAVSEE